MRPIWARRRNAAAFHLGPPRLGQAEIQGSQQTLRWRGMDSNLQFRDASPPPRAWLLSFGGTFCRTANAPSGSAQAVLKWIWEYWAWVFSRSGSGICPVVRVVPLPASAMRNSSSFLTPLRNEQIRPGDLHECTFFDAAPSATSCRYLGVR